MEGSSKQRYKEDKKLGDIINDMGYGEANIEKNILRSMQSERFSKELIKTITAHHHKVDKFETEYKNIFAIITDMENLYDSEVWYLNNYKKVIEKQNTSETPNTKIIKQAIRDHVVNIQNDLDSMTENRQSLYNKLASLAKNFPDEEDKTSHIKKINDFWHLFQKIYDDISDISSAQQQLVKKIR